MTALAVVTGASALGLLLLTVFAPYRYAAVPVHGYRPYPVALPVETQVVSESLACVEFPVAVEVPVGEAYTVATAVPFSTVELAPPAKVAPRVRKPRASRQSNAVVLTVAECNQSTPSPAIGCDVIRTDGGAGYRGMIGTVVELTDSRARVLWHTEASGATVKKQKRTWVKFDSLRAKSGKAPE